MNLAVIITAAGSSARYHDAARAAGAELGHRSKLDEDLGGRSVLLRSVELFASRPETRSIIVAAPHADDAFASFSRRHADALAILGCRVVRGGPRHRWESVRAALAALPTDATHVAVHDAARPGTPPELIDRVLDRAQHFPAVIPGVPVADTLRRTIPAPDMTRPADPLDAILGPSNEPTTSNALPSSPTPSLLDATTNTDPRPHLGHAPLRTHGTIDRTGLVAVQTPQVFERSVLERAYENPDPTATDDAHLVERLGVPVLVVPGDARNLKLTTPTDLMLLRALLGLRPPAERPNHLRF
jgi:2-C-methyl-D-erythritol 4-phosphate cytidylyltransferase